MEVEGLFPSTQVSEAAARPPVSGSSLEHHHLAAGEQRRPRCALDGVNDLYRPHYGGRLISPGNTHTHMHTHGIIIIIIIVFTTFRPRLRSASCRFRNNRKPIRDEGQLLTLALSRIAAASFGNMRGAMKLKLERRVFFATSCKQRAKSALFWRFLPSFFFGGVHGENSSC